MKLAKHVNITGVLHCDSGMRIGGTREGMEIGGQDNPVIRHPLTRLPYLPGSSVKGKMRSLLELRYSPETQRTGRPCTCGKCDICHLFGCGATRSTEEPTRLIARDCSLTEDWKEQLLRARTETGLDFVEVKIETAINRQTGMALTGSLRSQERVPAGAEFIFSLALRLFEGDDEQKMLDLVREGLSLVQQEYLGGSGSRGYGKVLFLNLKVDGKDFQLESGS